MLRSLILTAAAGLALLPNLALGQTSTPEAELKSAMIYNFARFAAWPPPRFADAGSPVVLCVSPSNSLVAALSRLEGKPVGGRRLRVRQTDAMGPGCHLAVLSPQESSAARISALNEQGVLTVGEAPGFAKSGAVGLVTVGRQTRFEINTKAAAKGGIALSSQLLRLAIVVR